MVKSGSYLELFFAIFCSTQNRNIRVIALEKPEMLCINLILTGVKFMLW